MGSHRAGVPIELAVLLRDDLHLVAAVETGAYLGASAADLAVQFDSVVSIELSAELASAAATRYSSVSNLSFVIGDSSTELPRVLSRLGGPALFWLDGHWSGGPTAGVERECPVLAEIDAIDRSEFASGSAVLVDDARLFLGPPPPPHKREHWPTLMQVTDRLRREHDRYVTLIEDVIVAVPPNAQDCVDSYWSTRPPHAPVAPQRLLRRLLPLIRGVRRP